MSIYIYDEDRGISCTSEGFQRYACMRLNGKGTRLKRWEILEKAKKVVMGDRETAYGSPEDNFATIAKLWGVYLGTAIEPEDVATMMILLKVARIRGGQAKDDNWIDIAGYAACGGECQGRREAEKDEA